MEQREEEEAEGDEAFLHHGEEKQINVDSHSQSEDFVPLWTEVLVNSVCL